MAERIRVFKVEIEDRPGSLYGTLSTISGAGLDLQCLGATSLGGGKGVMYIVPKDVEAALSFAERMGVTPEEMTGIMITGEDKAGAGAEALNPLKDAGINGMFCMATCFGGQFVLVLIVNQEDGDAAAKAYGC